MLVANILKWFRGTTTVMFVAGATLVFNSPKAVASQKVIFKYSGATQSVSLEELQEFAQTGEISPSLDFLLKFGKQNPYMIRWILTQQFPANTQLIYDLLNTAPGEYVLSQTGNVVSSKSERANIKALRGALITSASDDNLISLLELLENYPTKEVYVDGKILAKAQRDLANFINETNKYIRIPLSFLVF
ncbi:MAG: alpha/beta hydrolase [Pleurocapsa sp. MO_226.B13]|nr:alpha/beta hydrolase [Pleurocapsa sp. MO_226.B13]